MFAKEQIRLLEEENVKLTEENQKLIVQTREAKRAINDVNGKVEKLAEDRE